MAATAPLAPELAAMVRSWQLHEVMRAARAAAEWRRPAWSAGGSPTWFEWTRVGADRGWIVDKGGMG